MLSLRAKSPPPAREHQPELWIGLAWIVGVGFALLARLGGVDATQRYGANAPGDLSAAVVTMSAITAILYVLLVPAPHLARVTRAVFAVFAALLGVGVALLASSHAGPILSGMFLWSLPVFGGAVFNAMDTIAEALAERPATSRNAIGSFKRR